MYKQIIVLVPMLPLLNFLFFLHVKSNTGTIKNRNFELGRLIILKIKFSYYNEKVLLYSNLPLNHLNTHTVFH